MKMGKKDHCVYIWGVRERWLGAKINDSNLHKFEEKIISVSDHGKAVLKN